jgi:hypothetical protein
VPALGIGLFLRRLWRAFAEQGQRAALAFNDVWIGDYNYVFAPSNRTLFYNQPGFDPARTLLLVDEAHNLPTRVADAYSHHVNAADARALLTELDHLRASKNLLRAWESWTLLLSALPAADVLDPALEADVADTLATLATTLTQEPIDSAALGPHFAELLWATPTLSEWLANPLLRKLLWSPRPAELSFTCLDAADALGLEIARAVHLLDPAALVLGGGLGLNDRYRALVTAAIERCIDRTYANLPAVVPAELGENAGIVGAALSAC